jgi:UDP-N-acetylglucosamine acyltransferase
MPSIHPTAIVDSKAELADDVVIGPYCLIDGPITIGAGTVILGHTHLGGPTIIGKECTIGPAAYVGLPPQHLAYKGQATHLIIGDNVTIRETATVHRAYHEGIENATRIGSRCFLMGGVHVAHDCILGDEVILANGVLLGGHVHVGNRGFLGGGSVVHQFARIGRLAMVQGNGAMARDVPPFAAVRYDFLKGYNAIGCRRAGMPAASIAAIRAAFHCIHSHRTVPAALAAISRSVPDVPEVRELLDFYRTSRRGVTGSLRFAGAGFGGGESDEENRKLPQSVGLARTILKCEIPK